MAFAAGERPRCECGRPAVIGGRCYKHRNLDPVRDRVRVALEVRDALRGRR